MARKKASIEDLDAEIARLEAELEALEHGMSPTGSRKAAEEAAAKARAGKPPEAVAEDAAAADAPSAEDAPAKKKRGLLGLGRKKAKAEVAEDAEAPAPTEDDASSGKKGRLGFLKRGRKKDADEAPADAEAADAPPDGEKPVKKGLLGKLPVPGSKKGADTGEEPLDEPSGPETAPAAGASPEDTDLAPPRLNGAAWTREDGVWRRTRADVPPETVRRVLDADGNVVDEAPATEDDLAALRDDEEKEKKGKKLLGLLGRK